MPIDLETGRQVGARAKRRTVLTNAFMPLQIVPCGFTLICGNEMFVIVIF